MISRKRLATLAPAVQRRIRVESRIVETTVAALLAAGYWLGVDTGGDSLDCDPTNARGPVLAALGECDLDRLLAFPADSAPDANAAAWVLFVYGNDGWDVISDYTTNLGAVLAPVLALADGLADGSMSANDGPPLFTED